MSRRFARSHARDWVAGFAMLSIILAPLHGCAGLDSIVGDIVDNVAGEVKLDKESTGLFLKSSASSGLLAAARGPDGEQFFAFGTTDANGEADIESLVAVDKDGGTSFVSFESGRPVHAQSADSSYAHATYDEVTATRLVGSIELYDASTGEKSFTPFDVDLTESATSVADDVEGATGQPIEVTDVPTAKTLKDAAVSQLRVTVFSPLFAVLVVPLVAVVAVMTVVFGQILVILLASVIAAVATVVVAVFLPLFIISELLAAVILTIYRVDFDLVFDVLPDPPVIILVADKRGNPALA